MSRSTTCLLAAMLAATPLVRGLPVIRAVSNASVAYTHDGGHGLDHRDAAHRRGQQHFSGARLQRSKPKMMLRQF